MKKKFLYSVIIFVSVMLLVFLGGTNVQAAKSRNLTKKELNTITKYLNKTENNGFLQSKYTKASKINLDMAFREVGNSNEPTKKEKKVLKKLGFSLEDSPIQKLTRKKLQKLYKEKTGKSISLKDLKKRLKEWTYVKQFDAFYTSHGDTSFQPVKATSGTVKNGTYYVNYKGTIDYIRIQSSTEDIKYYKKGKVELKKVKNTYRFVSNKGVNKVTY